MLPARDAEAVVYFFDPNAREAQRVQRHIDIARRLQLPGDVQCAAARKTRQRHQQAGDVLRRNAAGKRISSALELPPHIQERAFPPERHTVRRKLRVQRCKRALREPPLHTEHSLRAQRAADWQQEAQRGAALSAEKRSFSGHASPHGYDLQKSVRAGYLRAQRAQTADRRVNVLRTSVQP